MYSLSEANQIRERQAEIAFNTYHGIYLSPESRAMGVLYNNDPTAAQIDEGMLTALFKVGEAIDWRRYLTDDVTLEALTEQLKSPNPTDRLSIAVYLPHLVNMFSEYCGKNEVFIASNDVDYRVRLPISGRTIDDLLPFSTNQVQ